MKHIVGQQKSTIDFNRILSQGGVVLVKLSSALAEDIKKFVGTILISELLHAVRNRPTDNRELFYIYVDEFQNFATSDDFATLITEARKYGIATTIAHQERFGQLGDNKKLLGATLAAANKIYFQLSVKDAQELAPEFAEMSKDTAYRQGADLVISPHAVEDIWEKGTSDIGLAHIRKAYFWIVDLLKRQKDYFVFDVSKRVPLPGVEEDLPKFEYDAFVDWEMYRASKDMVREGIEIINQYYYDYMAGKYKSGVLITDEQIRISLKLIECLSGLFGIRPVMEPYIPDDMRLLLLQRMNDKDQKERDKIIRDYKPNPLSAGWERQDALNMLIEQKDLHLFEKWRLEQIPTRVDVNEINKHYQLALAYGFSASDLNKFIKWRIAKVHQAEQDILARLVAYFNNVMIDNKYLADYAQLNIEYIAVMCIYPMYLKFGRDWKSLPDEVTNSYMFKVAHRIAWQVDQLMAFCNYITYLAVFALESQPIKVPSGHYTEPLKREQTQRELIDKMAQELSSLPRFHAWIKTFQKKWDEDKYIDIVEKHKIQIMSVEKYAYESEHKSEPIPLDKFCKLRSEIEEEIAKRQAIWKRGLSSPPAEKKEERQADTSSKPPPTITTS